VKSASVFVGVGKVWLEIPECKSLKEKRSALKPLLAKIRDKFQVSASEIGHHDVWQSSVIGLCLLGNRGQDIERYMHAIIDAVRRDRRVKLVDYRTEVTPAGGVDREPGPRPADDEILRSVEEAWIGADKEGG
jgi:uncharacterized protein YlxP (DUF503 family)